MIKKHIPNAITCMNLSAGCVAIVYGFEGSFYLAALFVGLAAFFDFLDGLAARVLHAYSPMGKELDSLADMVSFGVAPGVIAFSYLSLQCMMTGQSNLLAYTGFLIPIFSALRLAKFNLDKRQTSSFLGLPTPANALFWVFSFGNAFGVFLDFNFNPIFIVFGILITSALLVSEIPMFSLKFSNLHWKGNRLRYYFLAGCLLLIFLLKINAVAPIILWYMVLSVMNIGFIKGFKIG